jgi:hypothetical protein
MRWLTCSLLLILVWPSSTAEEPSPRALAQVPLRIQTPLTHVSAAYELSDGRVLISNARQPSVLLLDPATGAAARIGEAGAGPGRYAQPGGVYAGPNGTAVLLDRGQKRTITISRDGALQDSRSIAVPGGSSSSDADVDFQRLDARGFVYFLEGRIAFDEPERTLVRFDAEAQKMETVARLRKGETRTIPAGDGMTFGRTVIGSPADGWGVAPDGRVAVVRADPYRVEWYRPGGDVTRGPAIATDAIPMTDADRKAFEAQAGDGVRVGRTGGAEPSAADLGRLFADTKPPFSPDDVLVSPDARVWVLRSRPHDATAVIYDVFDPTGRRVDRIELPDGSRVVGFGRGTVYARWTDEGGRCELRKYRIK